MKSCSDQEAVLRCLFPLKFSCIMEETFSDIFSICCFVWVFKGGSFQEALSMGLLAIGNLRAQLSYDLIPSFS